MLWAKENKWFSILFKERVFGRVRNLTPHFYTVCIRFQGFECEVMISVFFDDWIENMMGNQPLVSQFPSSYGWFDQPQTIELIRTHEKGCLL